MNKRRIDRSQKRTNVSYANLFIKVVSLAVLLVSLFSVVLVAQNRQTLLGNAAPSAELQTDKTNQSFTANGLTSEYHILS